MLAFIIVLLLSQKRHRLIGSWAEHLTCDLVPRAFTISYSSLFGTVQKAYFCFVFPLFYSFCFPHGPDFFCFNSVFNRLNVTTFISFYFNFESSCVSVLHFTPGFTP